VKALSVIHRALRPPYSPKKIDRESRNQFPRPFRCIPTFSSHFLKALSTFSWTSFSLMVDLTSRLILSEACPLPVNSKIFALSLAVTFRLEVCRNRKGSFFLNVLTRGQIPFPFPFCTGSFGSHIPLTGCCLFFPPTTLRAFSLR